MNIPEELQGVLISTPDTLGGDVRFRGTRIPVRCLLDTMAAGEGLEEFLDNWPDVTRAQAKAVIRWEQLQARKALGLELVEY